MAFFPPVAKSTVVENGDSIEALEVVKWNAPKVDWSEETSRIVDLDELKWRGFAVFACSSWFPYYY